MGVHQQFPKSATTVVSTKGQVILPKAIRDERKWPAGTILVVEDTPQGVLLKPWPFPPTTIDQVAGCLKWDGPPISIEEMDAAITAEGKRRARD
jgi:AbrB family looped-hinge helix DNA binding protein